MLYIILLISTNCSKKNEQQSSSSSSSPLGVVHLANVESNQWEFTIQSYLNISPLQQAAIACEKAVVGVMDTGADTNHPDLNSIISSLSYNFADDSKFIYDKQLHGSHVTGIIGAIQNNEGVRGTCPNMQVAVLQVSNTEEGLIPGNNILEAIGYAKSQNIPILNGSFVFLQPVDPLKSSIESFPGLYIAAAGNAGESLQVNPLYPAAYNLANMITVAALDETMNITSFSSYDSNSVHIGAPGANILSSAPLELSSTGMALCKQQYQGICTLSGTSQAAPHVAAAAGILLAQKPDLQPADIRSKILDNATTSPTLMNKIAGGRILNLGALVIP